MDAIKTELEEMRRTDQAIRERAMRVIGDHGRDSEEYASLVADAEAVDERNTKRLIEILDTHGWPKLSEVGEEASSGAFLVLQHASPELQKQYLPLVRQAAAEGDMDRKLLPLLEDRIRVRDGEKQIYGTQVGRDESGEPHPFPMEDPDNVDARRAEFGLEPMAAYLDRFRRPPGA